MYKNKYNFGLFFTFILKGHSKLIVGKNFFLPNGFPIPKFNFFEVIICVI